MQTSANLTKFSYHFRNECCNLFCRLEILKIHAAPIAKHGEVDYEAVVKLSDAFNGADLRNVCTEAGLFAIRAEREYIVQVIHI